MPAYAFLAIAFYWGGMNTAASSQTMGWGDGEAMDLVPLGQDSAANAYPEIGAR
jgi:hypothetical protein